jgi:ubiquinone/menaquinone biosynthesis C-methylase UbiE
MIENAATLRARMYGEDDLSSLAIFAGGFINFGYWRDIPYDGPCTVEQRIESQTALYRQVFASLQVGAADTVLEVGSGTGVGGALAFAEFGPKELHGIDLSADQVARARARVGESSVLTYREGAADAIPFPDAAFDVVLSIEAAQHMDDITGFVNEAYRVLRGGGRFAVCTFFAPNADHPGRLAQYLDTFRTGIDRAHVVPDVVGTVSDAGFDSLRVTSIGEHVWPGLDRWIAHIGVPDDAWPRRWLTAYRDGLIDYYLISAVKSAERTM